MIAEALDEGKAGKRMKVAKALTAAGTVGAAVSGIGAAEPSPPARRAASALGRGDGGARSARARRALAIASGAALLAGSAFTRFGIFEGGMASARDPKYTVEPQRARLEAKRSASA